MRGKLRDAQARLRTAEQAAKDAEKRAGQAERGVAAAEKRLASAEEAVAKKQDLLDRADALQAAGFGEDALARLGQVLAGAAQAESKAAEEVVAAFLDAAADWRRLAELRAQVAAAEERAQQAEAGCRRREREAKVRAVAVDWAVWLVRRKITAETVAAWQAVAEKLGLADEALAVGVAGALEQHGSLEATRKAWSAAVAKLRSGHARLTGEVAALRRERDGLGADIDTVRDAAIAKVREVAEAATAQVRRAAAEFERLTADAAELREEVAFARALRVGTPALWRHVQPTGWQGFLLRLEQWSEANLANPEVPLPETIAKQAKGSKDYPALYGPLRVPLRGLVAWLRAGVAAADAEPLRMMLAGGAEQSATNGQ